MEKKSETSNLALLVITVLTVVLEVLGGVGYVYWSIFADININTMDAKLDSLFLLILALIIWINLLTD